MALSKAALAARKRLYEDFEFYAKHAIKIRTKDAKIAPLILNRGQRALLAECERQMAERGFIRLVILKGRQMGSSTFVESYLYARTSQRKAMRSLVIAHDAEATRAIFGMTKTVHDNCPEALRPQTARSSVKELVFDQLQSSYRIATAGGDGIVRGETIQAAHLSEVAWWPSGSAEANYSGLMDAVPPLPGTAVFVESTANGFNMFHRLYDTAEHGEGLFRPIFLPWYWDDGYKLPVPADIEWTPTETQLFADHADNGLTPEHLMFRRAKIAEKGLELWKQEYPSTPEEAFLTSGYPVFNPEIISPMLKSAEEPKLKLDLEGKKWEPSSIGRLSIWQPPREGAEYYIGADVGAGVRKDYSVAAVMNTRREVVAVWRCHRTDPAMFGRTLCQLGYLYNEAYLAVERNQHGILTNYIIDRDEAYPNLHREVVVDKLSDRETEVIGFLTTEKSKPMIVDTMREHLREGLIKIPDAVILKEMLSYIVLENGKMSAETNHHDDCVIALCLANYVNSGEWVPLPNQDNFYLDARDDAPAPEYVY